MVSKIRVLSEHTINQIAAGEVVENPASVVKELVENAIDAGSNEICVEIRGGGRQLIRVTDNGCGMNADDALLCLERHATSKIKDVNDISTALTMGFRGEAIPSIASISKFMLLTCEHAAEHGTMLIVDGGQIVQCTPAARSPGTTIEVKSLFFNVPVRRKFQKSPTYDSNEILKILSLIAMGHSHIKFEFIDNQESVFSPPLSFGDSFLDQLGHRISSTMGTDFFASTCPVDVSNAGYSVKGFIGFPSYTRPNRTGQYLFINNRAVTSPLISCAVRDGYGTTLATSRYPVYVLHLSVPGDLVDVNVHPQKREVRLRQEQVLKELVMKSVENALGSSGALIAPKVSFQSQQASPPFSAPSFSPFEPRHVAPTFAEKALVADYKSTYRSHQIHERPLVAAETQPELFAKPVYRQHLQILATIPGYILIDPCSLIKNDQSPFTAGSSDRYALTMIDQRAAHSRILFEKLQQKQTLISQPLLIPHSFEATPMESALLVEQQEFLNQIGIQIHQSGPHSFIVDALPELFGKVDVQALLSDVVHQLRDFHAMNPLQKEQEKRLAISASRAAISNRKKLSLEEAQSLVNRLMHCGSPFQCPQGKPTMAIMTGDELQKYF